MKQRRLGSSGPFVAEIGLGCMSMSGFYGPANDTQSMRLMARALELGVDFFDTANVYGLGHNEELIGRFLKTQPKSRWPVLATKGGIKRDPITNARSFDNSRDHLAGMLEASLGRLGVDRVDLYYAHRREPGRPIEETAQTMASFAAAGKIGGYGLSEVSPETIRRAHAVHPLTAVQSEYSLWTREPDSGVVSACRELGIAFVAFGAVGRKILTATLTETASLQATDFRKKSPRFVEPNFSENLRRLEPFFAAALARGHTPAQWALAWVLAQGEHVIPIPGTRDPDRLAENVAASDAAPSPADLAEIGALLPKGFAVGERYTPEQYVGVERY